MPNKTDVSEIVHEGWLTKSPPSKRIWRARWRRRWFVLQHSGELPGQYFLCYYTDRSRRTLKGQIDLDECEQVDAGLQFENSKHKYQFMFDVRTPKRVYYLAAETEAEMNKWVDCICHVCGLKSYPPEDNAYTAEEHHALLEEANQNTESPPVSPASTASGPYIPISECRTGKPLSHGSVHDEFYDSPRNIQPSANVGFRASGSTTPPLQSPGTDAESVFTDEEWTNSKPAVNWDTFPDPSDSSLEDVKATLTVGKRSYTKPLIAPPRPPKPQHLVLKESSISHTYGNLGSPRDTVENNGGNLSETYDFPRSHHFNGEQENIDPIPVPNPRHCYTNAAPGNVGGIVFNYDFPHYQFGEEPASPNSEASSNAQYSNMSSPVWMGHPPVVNRGLKPGRKASDPVSNEPSPSSLSRLRIMKPIAPERIKDESVPLKLCSPPQRRPDSHSIRYHSSNPPASKCYGDPTEMDVKVDEFDVLNHENPRFVSSPQHKSPAKDKNEIHYLDLDLGRPENGTHTLPTELSSTEYKEVDFVKTEAFNRTKQKVEEERNNAQL